MLGEQPDGTFRVEKLEPAKKRISISQMNALSQCGEKYRRQYIQRDYSPRPLTMIVGSVVDLTVTANLRAKIQCGVLLPVPEIVEMARIKFREAINEVNDRAKAEGFTWGIHFKEEEILGGRQESINEAQAKAVRLSKLHAEMVAPNLSPLFVQRPLFVELPGYPFDFGGILDIEEADSVRDTKTKAKSPSKGDSYKEDQLTAYALLRYIKDNVIPPRLILDCLVDTKIPKYVPDESTRTEEDFDVLLRRLDAACYAIDRQVFIPARETDWWCGKDACSFWETCKFVKRSRRPAA